MNEREILTFRVDSACYFRNQFYKATDEEGGTTHQFPFGALLNVPQHFTLLDDEGEVDKELQPLRDKFFAWSLPILADSTPKNSAELMAKVEAGKANFLAYGQPEAPRLASATAPSAVEGNQTGDEIDKMTRADLSVELDKLAIEYKSNDDKATLVAKLREGLAAKATVEAGKDL